MNNIKFNNSTFEQAVRDNLGVPSRELTKEDILMITGIHIHQGKVDHHFLEQGKDSLLVIGVNLQENHTGWQQDILFFKHISFLNISIPTEDISFLSGFIKLQELALANSSNRNWSFLSNLVELKHLAVFDSQFSDLQPLDALAFNQRQFFENRKLTLAKPVSMFYQGLSNLRIINCGITDPTPLIHSKWLSELDLSSNKITDWSVLTND
ncbi:hypothetical protein [Salipaludibacillus sp. CF4.18]|uniref:hypothetical protein n=1 Tax=Salipaludibacillus sp. CF4.18 TaxID=3373081 RepID=UPI003EE52C2D